MTGNDQGKKVDELNVRGHGCVEHETSLDSICSEEDEEDEDDLVNADLDEVDDNENREHDEETSAFPDNLYPQSARRNGGHAASW